MMTKTKKKKIDRKAGTRATNNFMLQLGPGTVKLDRGASISFRKRATFKHGEITHKIPPALSFNVDFTLYFTRDHMKENDTAAMWVPLNRKMAKRLMKVCTMYLDAK